MLGCLTQIYKT
uniref:Uncharacterized protein n=1 Tax=Anguilla anguilla TaxID=7936 RepID=A0A0E9VYB1_ANGAN